MKTNKDIIVSFKIRERTWILSTAEDDTLIIIDLNNEDVHFDMSKINTLDQDTIENLFHVFHGMLLDNDSDDYDQWYEDLANKIWQCEISCLLPLKEV